MLSFSVKMKAYLDKIIKSIMNINHFINYLSSLKIMIPLKYKRKKQLNRNNFKLNDECLIHVKLIIFIFLWYFSIITVNARWIHEWMDEFFP